MDGSTGFSPQLKSEWKEGGNISFLPLASLQFFQNLPQGKTCREKLAKIHTDVSQGGERDSASSAVGELVSTGYLFTSILWGLLSCLKNLCANHTSSRVMSPWNWGIRRFPDSAPGIEKLRQRVKRKVWQNRRKTEARKLPLVAKYPNIQPAR